MPGHSPITGGQVAGFGHARGSSFNGPYVDAPGEGLRPAPRKHGLSTPVPLVDQRYLLFAGTPHPQSLRELTADKCRLVGSKTMLALKVMDLKTQAVLTLLEGVDPQRRITAGPG